MTCGRATQRRSRGSVSCGLSLAACAAATACATLDCALPECDVRDAACQRDVMAATACLREAPPLSIPILIRSRDELVAEAVAESSSIDAAVWRERQAALALLELEPAGATVEEIAAETAGGRAAYYSIEDDRIVISDGFGELDGLYATALLAHEISHAMQARVAPFDVPFPSLDAAIASAAVREGDAVWTQDRLFALGAGREPGDIDWDDIHRSWAAVSLEAYRAQPSKFHFARSYFSYPFGTRRAALTHAEGGQAAIDAMIESPPLSMYDLIEPPGFDRAAAMAAIEPRAVPALDADLLRATGIGWWILWEGSRVGDTLRLGVADSSELVLEADVLSLWAHRDSRAPLAALRLRFSDAEQAERVVRAFSFDADVIVSAEGQEVALVFVPDADWNAELRAAPPSWQALPAGEQ